jgi:carboxylesterase
MFDNPKGAHQVYFTEMKKSNTETEHAALLIHGLSGNPLEMQYLAKRLRQAGIATFVPHFKGYGFGERTDPFASGTWQQWRAQVLDHFDELARNYQSVSVSGLCVGAVLALDLAAERPGKVAALSLLATTLAYDGWSIPWYHCLASLAYYTPLRYRYSYQERHPYGVKNEALRKWIAREMSEKTTSIAGASSLPMTAVYQAKNLIRHVRRVIPAVSAPALVIHAKEDDVASLKSAEFVLENIGSDDLHFVLLHDSYHIVTLDNEKELVADETIRFFCDRIRKTANAPMAGGTRRDVANKSAASA